MRCLQLEQHWRLTEQLKIWECVVECVMWLAQTSVHVRTSAVVLLGGCWPYVCRF